jgi:hypothetical protein
VCAVSNLFRLFLFLLLLHLILIETLRYRIPQGNIRLADSPSDSRETHYVISFPSSFAEFYLRGKD